MTFSKKTKFILLSFNLMFVVHVPTHAVTYITLDKLMESLNGAFLKASPMRSSISWDEIAKEPPVGWGRMARRRSREVSKQSNATIRPAVPTSSGKTMMNNKQMINSPLIEMTSSSVYEPVLNSQAIIVPVVPVIMAVDTGSNDEDQLSTTTTYVDDVPGVLFSPEGRLPT